MADQEREPAAGPQERVEAFADEAVIALRGRRRVLDEEVGGEHPGLQPVVDALAVHRVDQPGGIADRNPARAVAALLDLGAGELSKEDFDRLAERIERARKEGR